MTPRVSIVIPTYQRRGMVETAIESVLSQDYEALELIVLDDGSTDETSELLARIAARTDPDRFSWDRHPNVGQATTVNRGFARARGELLGYLSSDDYLLPGAIARLVAEIDAHPEAEVVYPFFRLVDDQDRHFDTYAPGQHTFVDAMRWAACMPGVGVLVRRSLYERIGGWDPRYKTCPDFEWWLRARDATFLRVPEALGVWRAHPGSISTAHLGIEAAYERLRLLDEIYASDDLPDELIRCKEEIYSTTLILCGVMINTGPDREGGRFIVHDTLGPVFTQAAGESQTKTLLALDRRAQVLDELVTIQQKTIIALDAALAARDGLRDEHVAHIDSLERALSGRAPNPRPLWLRAARAAVPAPLRPRLGAAVHRLRARA